jgi:hypothetical protein
VSLAFPMCTARATEVLEELALIAALKGTEIVGKAVPQDIWLRDSTIPEALVRQPGSLSPPGQAFRWGTGWPLPSRGCTEMGLCLASRPQAGLAGHGGGGAPTCVRRTGRPRCPTRRRLQGAGGVRGRAAPRPAGRPCCAPHRPRPALAAPPASSAPPEAGTRGARSPAAAAWAGRGRARRAWEGHSGRGRGVEDVGGARSAKRAEAGE